MTGKAGRPFSVVHSILFLIMVVIVLPSCARRSKRFSIPGAPQSGAIGNEDIVDDEIYYTMEPQNPIIGQTVTIRAELGNSNSFQFEILGAIPSGVSFLSNQFGVSSVQLTSSQPTGPFGVRIRPTNNDLYGDLESIIWLSFAPAPVDPAPVVEPELNCQFSSLTGTSYPIGTSGIFEITDLNQNAPLQITNLWTHDSREIGYWWNNIANMGTLSFWSSGRTKIVFARARRTDLYYVDDPYRIQPRFECEAQIQVYVSP